MAKEPSMFPCNVARLIELIALNPGSDKVVVLPLSLKNDALTVTNIDVLVHRTSDLVFDTTYGIVRSQPRHQQQRGYHHEMWLRVKYFELVDYFKLLREEMTMRAESVTEVEFLDPRIFAVKSVRVSESGLHVVQVAYKEE